MVEDLKRGKAEKNTSLYSILVATHPLEKIDEMLSRTALSHDYVRPINEAFEIYETPEKILETCKKNVEIFFKNRNIDSTYGISDAGKCFGIEVSLPFWIIGPYTKSHELLVE